MYFGSFRPRLIGWDYLIFEYELGKSPELIYEGYALTFKKAVFKKEITLRFLNNETTFDEWLRSS